MIPPLCRPVALLLLVWSPLPAQSLEQSFRDLPASARRLTGPLFWLHGDERFLCSSIGPRSNRRPHHQLHTLRRVNREGRDVILLANQSTSGNARTFSLVILGTTGSPEVWDAMRNEICSVPSRE